MSALRLTFSVAFLLTAALAFGQQGSSPPATAKPSEGHVLCKPGSLPTDIQNHLKGEFGSWKVQEPAELSPHAHERWESEKPLACPGIAVGKFENAATPYLSLVHPMWKNQYGDYDHLARVKEWSLSGGGDEGES